ncbi:siderophore-interacting protein [Actinomadura parmotrematis]|uniref:Siderophore-interacting protein n=1 Tax=Actinomadura parmotrematis TaxID=2864039 RepID=A0ABS7FWJ0_9ACTN|nr:siderophore-interacting protein [Actinomadura parmotrematis]MBW8484350.1 siderophore-interacting protein [Actinomadura parmotrematis]
MSPSLSRLVLDKMFTAGRVTAAGPISPRLRGVTVTGPDVRGLGWTPGQQVRLLVGEPFALRTWTSRQIGDVLRTYSVRRLAGDSFDLVGFDHGGDGPGERWFREAEPGREVLFRGPEGGFVIDAAAPYHLFAGEETATVAFAAMLDALPPDAAVHGAVEAGDAADHQDLARDLVRVDRGDVPAASSEALLKAVASLDLPDAPGTAYLAGEARTIQAIRAHLVRERGWDRRNVRTKPFWTPGKRGLD